MVANFIAGQVLTAGQLNDAAYPLFVYKPGNEGRTNTTTMTDDAHLFVTVNAYSTYLVEASIGTLANTTADGQLRWSYPSDALLDWGQHNLTPTATGIAGQGDWNYRRETGSSPFVLWWGGANSPFDALIKIGGLLRVGGTSGTFRLQWAQLVSDPGTSWVLQGSWLRLTKVV